MEDVVKVYKIKGGISTEVFFSSQEAAENAVKANPARYSFSPKVAEENKEPEKKKKPEKKKESEDLVVEEIPEVAEEDK